MKHFYFKTIFFLLFIGSFSSIKLVLISLRISIALTFNFLEKEIKFSEADCLKSFKAYVFGLRSGVTYKPAAGWDIKDEENIDIVIDIIKKDASISDAL